MGLIKSVRKIGSKVGGVLKKAAPLAGLIPGVGTAIGAGIGALGSVMEGHNGLSGTLKAAAGGAAGGLANKVLLGGKGVLGVGGAAGKLADIVKTGKTGDPIADAAVGLIAKKGTAGGGIDLGKLLGLGLGGYAAVTGNKDAEAQRKKQEVFTGKQLGIADEIAARGRMLNANADKMRDASAPALLARVAAGARSTPSFAARFTDARNPFAKNYPAPPTATPPMGMPSPGQPIAAAPAAPAPALPAAPAGLPLAPPMAMPLLPRPKLPLRV